MRARAGMPLWMALSLALTVKVLLLVLLYKACFAAPQAKKMRMPTATVEQHLLGSAAAPSSPPLPPSVSKATP
ncbi:MAG: cytochrome oxidase putative small subunit CydP [Massilia sp.]